MSSLNWAMVSDGGIFESLMHAILYAEDAGTVLFGRPSKDAGQDARSSDGSVIYQAKYRQGLKMDGAINLAIKELSIIKKYSDHQHQNYKHWKDTQRWVLVANFCINPNDDLKWKESVVPEFQKIGITAEYWDIEKLEGKLTQNDNVRDVFFGGENRVLVGLKEARDLLSAATISSASFDFPVVDRQEEIEQLCAAVNAGEKYVIPVVGIGGIGKSRILYETLLSLAQNDWRVLWALPGTMARSSRWFSLLNGNQPTCVAIDAPDDPNLLRAIIEQLSTIERKNWRFIIAGRNDTMATFREFKTHRLVDQPLTLNTLDEDSSRQLFKTLIVGDIQENWLHSVFQYTRGIPGWLCLIAELVKCGSLAELPSNIDDIATNYVDSCLNSLKEEHRSNGRLLLRWLALWGFLKIETDDEKHKELKFLENNGISNELTVDLLRDLTELGIIRNWGISKRFFAIEPLLIREQILSSWLLTREEEQFKVNNNGARIVNQLVEGQIPAVQRTLHSLSQLTISRVDENESGSFIEPIFDYMLEIVRTGKVLNQYHVADLIDEVGAADPECALDVLISIRQNPKEKTDIDVAPWGPQTFTHASLVTKIPWILFQIAENIADGIVAKRYLIEFEKLVEIEDAGGLVASGGKSARQLIKRMLCGSRNSKLFAQPANDIVISGLKTAEPSSYIVFLLECLFNPERRITEWVSTWTLNFTRQVLLPGSSEWNLATELRKHVFDLLRSKDVTNIRAPLWDAVAESHHEFHRAILHGSVQGDAIEHYQAVLIEDLNSCLSILTSPPVTLSIEEATSARSLWSWYLSYGQDEELKIISRQCEQVYNDLSHWRLHEFFRFRSDEELAPSTDRLVKILREASNSGTFEDFFAETKHYLDVARRGQHDGADIGRIKVLANACADLLVLDTPSPNPLTSFVTKVLKQVEDVYSLPCIFAVRICQQYIKNIKRTRTEADVQIELNRILELTETKPRLLYALFAHARPVTIGPLTNSEFNCVLTYKKVFSSRELFILLGEFAALFWDTVHSHLQSRIENMKDQPVEASRCLACFIQSLDLTELCFDLSSSNLLIAWIIDVVQNYYLDGKLLGMYELTRLREKNNFKLDMVQAEIFIHSRMELEKSSRSSDQFEILPRKFKITSWCIFDETKSPEVEAFYRFCQIALGSGFTALYWMPKYVALLDPSGLHVASFINNYLDYHPEIDVVALARLGYLASAYQGDSDAWAVIARPICSKVQALRRKDREHVYFGLSRKETGIIQSIPGEVADYYIKVRDNAKRMNIIEPNDSPLKQYREWALRCAETDLRRAQGHAEEIAND